MNPLDSVTAARIPTSKVSALAGYRTLPGVSVILGESESWVQWSPQGKRIITALLTVPGVEWFFQKESRWFRLGEYLPTHDVPPMGESRPLDRVIFPAPFTVIPPGVPNSTKILVTLVSGDCPQPTTALRCPINSLDSWVEWATTAQLQSINICLCDDLALLIGPKLPFIEGAELFWGREVLIPLGFRTEPRLTENDLRELANVSADELLMLLEDHHAIVPKQVLEPLTRARWRALRST